MGWGSDQRGGKSARRQMPHGAFVWLSVGAVMVADTYVCMYMHMFIYIDTDTHAHGMYGYIRRRGEWGVGSRLAACAHVHA